MRLDRLDERVKLYMLLAMSTASVASKEPAILALLLTETAAILFLGGVSPAQAFGRVRGALKLILSLFLLQCIFLRSGQALISVGGTVLLRSGGLKAGITVCLRLLILLLTALILMTGSRRNYLLALSQLGLPYEICFMVMAAMRFMPLLREEASDVMCAVQMRGTKIRHTGLKHRISVYIKVALPIVAGAIRRSEQMSTAMEARAFRSMPRRTSMRALRMSAGDWIYMAVFTAVLAAGILGVKLWLL